MEPLLTVDQLYKDNEYVYQEDLTPLENYSLFEQSISFLRGVDFIELKDDKENSFVHLIKLPGLNLDLDLAKEQFKVFSDTLLNRLENIINTQEDVLIIFSSIYDLYRRVQSDCIISNTEDFPFIGRTKIIEYEIKDFRQAGLRPVKTRFISSFPEVLGGLSKPVYYNEIAFEVRNIINKIYRLRFSFLDHLFKELKTILLGLLNDKKSFQHFRYEGDTADLVEIAMALKHSGLLKPFGDKNLSDAEFARQFCLFFGKEFSNYTDQFSTITKRYREQKSFYLKLKGYLKDYTGL